MSNKIRTNLVNAWALERHYRLLEYADMVGRKMYWPQGAIQAEKDNNEADCDLKGEGK